MTKDLGVWTADDRCWSSRSSSVSVLPLRYGGCSHTQVRELAASRVTRTIVNSKEVLL
jgi:hypothetical protein